MLLAQLLAFGDLCALLAQSRSGSFSIEDALKGVFAVIGLIVIIGLKIWIRFVLWGGWRPYANKPRRGTGRRRSSSKDFSFLEEPAQTTPGPQQPMQTMQPMQPTPGAQQHGIVACPFCQAHVERTPQLVAQIVACPNCRGQFQMP